jgi:hypothetical protein
MAVPAPGIAGIDGSKMVYGAWFLFNEAHLCLLNSQHFGAIVSLTASVELCLRSLLQEKSHDVKLVELIRRAREKGFVTREEETDLDNLRDLRNHYVHFELQRLPVAKEVFETRLEDVVAGRVSGSMKVTDAYPSEDYRYFIPLMAAAGLSGIYLEFCEEFEKCQSLTQLEIRYRKLYYKTRDWADNDEERLELLRTRLDEAFEKRHAELQFEHDGVKT